MTKRVRVKPTKGQATISLIIGVIFVIIGVVSAIPSSGFLGVIWTVLAMISVGVSAYNIFSDKGIASADIEIQDGQNDIESRLRNLDELYQKGLISRLEYDEQRRKIIEEI